MVIINLFGFKKRKVFNKLTKYLNPNLFKINNYSKKYNLKCLDNSGYVINFMFYGKLNSNKENKILEQLDLFDIPYYNIVYDFKVKEIFNIIEGEVNKISFKNNDLLKVCKCCKYFIDSKSIFKNNKLVSYSSFHCNENPIENKQCFKFKNKD
jgi:hypothetical protein